MRNKRKGILMASAILGSAAIVSTGFAAWVITVEDTEVAQGDIQVDRVEDKTHIITMDPGNDLTVKYGMGGSTTNPNPWLTHTGDLNEDFSVTCNFTVTHPESCDFNDVSLTVIEGDAENKYFAAAVTAKYFSQPTVKLVKAADFSSSGKASLNFVFAWGEYFDKDGTADEDLEDNVNPYEFFNAKTTPTAYVNGSSGNTWAQEAVAVLTAIYNAKDTKFSVTIATKTVNP